MALVNFNIPGQRIPAAAVGPAYQAGMTNINEFAPDQGMVNALLQRGSSTAPVQSVQEGLYRALTGVAGGYMKGRDKRDLQSQRDAYGEAVMGALAKGQGTAGTAAIPADISTTPTSILDNPSVPDVASLGLERIETPTGPGGQIIEKQAVAGTPGTPGGLQPMLDALRGDGTRDPRLQSALNETALMMQYGGLQDEAALEAQAAARKAAREDYLYQQENKAVTPAKDPTSVQEWRFAQTQGETRDYPTWLQASILSKTPSNAGETAEQEFIGRVRGGTFEAITNNASAAREQITALDSFDAGDFETGSFAGARVTLGKMAQFLGIAPEEIGINGVADAQTMRTASNKLAKSMRVAGEGVMSDADLKLLIESVVSLNNTREANEQISAVMRTIATRSILRERMANEWLDGEGNDSMRGFSKVWQDYIDGESLFPEGYSGAVDRQLPDTPGYD